MLLQSHAVDGLVGGRADRLHADRLGTRGTGELDPAAVWPWSPRSCQTLDATAPCPGGEQHRSRFVGDDETGAGVVRHPGTEPSRPAFDKSVATMATLRLGRAHRFLWCRADRRGVDRLGTRGTG